MKKTDKFSILKNIDLKGAKVRYNSFDIEPNIPIVEQYLSEDLLAIHFGDIYTIDIGWYWGKQLGKDGFFRIVVVRYHDWDNPIWSIKTTDIAFLKNKLQEAINFVSSFNDKNLKKRIKRFRNKILQKIDIKSGKIDAINLFLEPIYEGKNTFMQIKYHDLYAIQISWHLDPITEIGGYYLINKFKIRVINMQNNQEILEREYDALNHIFDDLKHIIQSSNSASKASSKESFLNYLIQDIDLKSGNIILDFFYINPDIPLKDQAWFLQKFLLIIVIENNKTYTVNIDWSKELDPNGSFEVTIEECIDNAKPLYKKETKDIDTLKKYLQEAINISYDLAKNKQCNKKINNE